MIEGIGQAFASLIYLVIGLGAAVVLLLGAVIYLLVTR